MTADSSWMSSGKNPYEYDDIDSTQDTLNSDFACVPCRVRLTIPVIVTVDRIPRED